MGVFLFVLAAMGSSKKEHKKKKVVEPESESSEEVEVPEQESDVESDQESSQEEEAPAVGQKRKLEQKDNGDAKKISTSYYHVRRKLALVRFGRRDPRVLR